MGVREWLARALGTEHSVEGDPTRVSAVQAVLAELAPLVELDGGRIELLRVDDDGTVHVRMRGACASCSQQASTLSQGLEPRLRAALPWMHALRSVE
jgi:Fe-S cluster biogenesis protein NfuA